MHILMILYNQVGRGTYWRALNLGRGLVEQQHQVTLLAMSQRQRLRTESFLDNGVLVVASPDLLWGALRSGWDPWDTANRIHWLRNRTFDIVHAFESRPVVIWPALYAQRFCDAKLVMDWSDWFGRGGSVEERTSPVVRTLLRPVETFFEEHFRCRADGTTVINTVLRDKALKLGVAAETLLLLRNGSDVDDLQSLSVSLARESLDLPLDVDLVGYVGAVFPRDAELMARAFDLIQATRPSARLLLVGYCNVPIEEYVSNPQEVYRTGWVPYADIGTYLSACDVCWLPLRNSGGNRGRWPLKLNDYLAVGRPIVATNVGDLTAFFSDHPVGLVVPDEPETLAEGVLTLLDSPQMAQTMGDLGRRLAETDFSWDALARELAVFYRQVLRGGLSHSAAQRPAPGSYGVRNSVGN